MKKSWKIIPVLALSLMLTAVISASAFAGALSGGPGNEPDGSGIPKDEPVSTTGNLYGYSGTFDLNLAISQPVSLSDEMLEINNEQRIFWGGPVIRNLGSFVLTVRNSYIRGETAVETVPWPDISADALAAGNMQAVLAVGSGYSYYINSSIVSRNLAALSTEGANQFMTPDRRELNVYAYGSEAITMEGGYGIYSDLFCNLYLYGSHIQAAETGIISGTYGNVAAGTIADGENDPRVDIILNDQDRAKRSDKQVGSVIEGGRNALMIHSENLPQYWEYENYSQDLLPWHHADISLHKSILRTDMSLDKGVKYDPEQQAYINHIAGSVILIKSTNAEIDLDECEIIPDEKGTGYLVQTAINNDVAHMNAVPENEEYPGIMMNMKNMTLKGDISHEDYQRDFYLSLENTTLDGAMNEYDCAHWNAAAADEGFSGYCPDAAYSTHHGLNVSIIKGSVWNVAKESHISRLFTDPDTRINGIIFVNGVEQKNLPGTVYEGNVVVKPLDPGITQKEPTKPEEQPTTPAPAEPAPKPAAPAPATPASTEHVHEWISNGESPADCTHTGIHVWVCKTCGEKYHETLPALGHDWYLDYELPASCTIDGSRNYRCSRCGAIYSEPNGQMATGHKMSSTPIVTVNATCETDGECIYQCETCLAIVKTETIPATGHHWHPDNIVYATCTTEGEEQWSCPDCGKVEIGVIPALGHDFHFGYHVPAGCENEGFDVYYCSRCSYADKFNNIPALGHSFTVAAHTPASCTEDEVYKYVCSVCGFEKYETILGTAIGHDYQVTSHVDPTCDSQGQDVYTCMNCGDVYYYDLPAWGHSWVFQYSVPVTCLTSGYDVYQCNTCGVEEWFNFQEATGHTYHYYPTPGNESLTHTVECYDCGDSYTEPHDSIGLGYCPACGYTGSFG